MFGWHIIVLFCGTAHSVTELLDNSMSSVGSDTVVLTLSSNYTELICIAGGNFGVYTDPYFSSSNSQSTLIHSTYYNFYMDGSREGSGSLSVDGTQYYSMSVTSPGSRIGQVVDVILNCKVGDVISLIPQPMYDGSVFTGQVAIYGIK